MTFTDIQESIDHRPETALISVHFVRWTELDIMASSEQSRQHKPSLLPQTQMPSNGHDPMPPSSKSSSAVAAATKKIETTTNNLVDANEVDYEYLHSTSIKAQLLAGGLAGIAEHSVLYPIDAIKVKRGEKLKILDYSVGLIS